jgi:hypothetical protein
MAWSPNYPQAAICAIVALGIWFVLLPLFPLLALFAVAPPFTFVILPILGALGAFPVVASMTNRPSRQFTRNWIVVGVSLAAVFYAIAHLYFRGYCPHGGCFAK